MLTGRFSEPGRIDLIDVPEPELIPGESPAGQILFQPELGCLCGSDIPYFEHGDTPSPIVDGHSLHEMIGTVLATTGDRYQPGERVLTVPVDQQGLSERYIISEERAIPIDTRVPEEQALMAQPLGTAIFALKKLPPLLDQDVVIVGQGPMGQLFCSAVRNFGARKIIVLDSHPARLEVSKKMGATHTICTKDGDPIEAVRSLTDGRFADVVIEAVGHERQALNFCIELARQAGRILMFGVPPKEMEDFQIRKFFNKNLTMHASVDPDFRRDFPLAMQWIGEGRVSVGHIITHRYPLAEIQTAFETFRDRVDGALKVLIDFPSGGK